MFSDPAWGKKATFSVQYIFRIQNNNTVVMGKFCMSSGLIVVLNEPLLLGVRRAIAGQTVKCIICDVYSSAVRTAATVRIFEVAY